MFSRFPILWGQCDQFLVTLSPAEPSRPQPPPRNRAPAGDSVPARQMDAFAGLPPEWERPRLRWGRLYALFGGIMRRRGARRVQYTS